jgi:hypothetical protein
VADFNWVNVLSNGSVLLGMLGAAVWFSRRWQRLEDGHNAIKEEVRHSRFCQMLHVKATRRIGDSLREHIIRSGGDTSLNFDDLERIHAEKT